MPPFSPKSGITDLALFGGSPAFVEPVHVGRPNIGDRARLMARINDALDRRWLSNHGPYVEEFQIRLAEKLGVRHCIAICNGTVALEIAIRAVGLSGEVIVPSFTFVATAHALQWQQITPVFGDIDPRTHALDPNQIECMITPRTTGIIGVHLWGEPCCVGPLTDIARRRGLKLMFDASHAFGCSHEGRMIGNFGAVEVFSFHATKYFNTFEGGAIATNDDALAERIQLMKNFGFSGYDRVVYLGTNGKMSEISAAMGLTGLEALDEFINVNRINYKHYRRHLHGIPGLALFAIDDRECRNYQHVVIEIDESKAGLNRDLMIRLLHAENVLARRYFHPGCHRLEPYRSYFPHAGLLLPETEALCDRVLVLPTGTAVDEADVGTICQIIRIAVENGLAITRRSV
ncbi:MAG TPA: DegT/DnrJ/EryC1/StrS family aminotransferase [Candidatus Acidoferrales bacterium]|nr:DegT/DnrJ/EryC1/StrS family aminotransferase [Candidatus Acidoferrales bacterium]